MGDIEADEEYVGVMDYSSMHLKVMQALEALCTIAEDSSFTLKYRVKVLHVLRILVEDTKKSCENTGKYCGDHMEELGIVDDIHEKFPTEAMEKVTSDPANLSERALKVAEELEFFDEYFPTMEFSQHLRSWASSVTKFHESTRGEVVDAPTGLRYCDGTPSSEEGREYIMSLIRRLGRGEE